MCVLKDRFRVSQRRASRVAGQNRNTQSRPVAVTAIEEQKLRRRIRKLARFMFAGAGEGVFCEPASTASVAGLVKRREEVPAGSTVVCVLTGNGLKDPTTAIEHNDSKFHTGLDPDKATVAQVMGF